MLVVGVSGATNGGKSTLAQALRKALPRSHLICQDTYFLPQESDRHVLIPQLNHFNWDTMSSLDMDKMWDDIKSILNKASNASESDLACCSTDVAQEVETEFKMSSKNDLTKIQLLNKVEVIIIEGFLVLNYKPIVDICHLKYHLTLEKEECYKRRCARIYDPPDVPGYFDLCVWPEYVKHKGEMLETVSDLKVIDGTRDINSIFSEVFNEIVETMKMMV